LIQPSSQHNLRQNADLTEVQVKQLMSVAGDHRVAESDWVQACLLLGDRQPDFSKRRRNRKLALILGSLVLVSAGVFWFGLSKNVDTAADPSFDHFAVAHYKPIPGVPIPPASQPEPGIPDTIVPAQTETEPTVAGEPDYGYFMAHIQSKIKRFWRPARSDVSRRVILLFKVNRNGEVSDLRVKDSSGVDTADAAALKAVEAAAPFCKLPAGEDHAVDIEFTFDYNVFQK
jgi:TonB family protein